MCGGVVAEGAWTGKGEYCDCGWVDGDYLWYIPLLVCDDDE